MSDATSATVRPLQPVEVWNETWRTFGRKPWAFVGLALLPIAASLVVSLVQGLFAGGIGLLTQGRDGGSGKTILVVIVVAFALIQYAVQFACQIAAIYGAGRVIAGASFGVGEAVGVGFRRLFPYLGLVILVTLVVLVGYLLLIVPGIIASLALILAVPTCIIEGYGPIESMKRSWALTQGNRWRIFLTGLLVFLLPMLGILAAFGALFFLLNTIGLKWLAVLPFIPMFPVFVAVGSIFLAVLLFQLRALREGRHPLEGLETVFD